MSELVACKLCGVEPKMLFHLSVTFTDYWVSKATREGEQAVVAAPNRVLNIECPICHNNLATAISARDGRSGDRVHQVAADLWNRENGQ